MRKLITILACILYCLWPFDAQVDFLPFIGLADDAIAIGLTLYSLLRKES